MRTKKRYRFDWDCLEQKALLAGVTPTQVAMAEGLNIGPTLPSADVQNLQQIASTNNLVTFLTQLAILTDRNAGIQQGAQVLLTDARNTDLRLHMLADSKGVPVPADIQGGDQLTAKQVVGTVGSTQFESTYQGAIANAEGQLVGQLRQANSTSDPDFQTFIKTTLPIAQADQATAQGASSGTSTTTPITTPSSTTLSGQDLNTLAQSYSTTNMERFLAQLTALETNNPNVLAYANKLISDHELESVQIGTYAAASNTFLPASLQGQDVSTAQQIIGAVNSPRYNVIYLQQMVQTHTQDIISNQHTVNTTTNPVLKQFAVDDLGTDFLHRNGAQYLLRTPGVGQNTSGSGFRLR